MEIEFIGISFRNQYHLNWFIATQFLFWLVVTITVTTEMITKKPWTLSSGYLFLAIIFGGISYGAYNLTEGGTIIPNAHTSPDCVWYNGGMALACVVIICFLWILKLFRPTREIEKIS